MIGPAGVRFWSIVGVNNTASASGGGCRKLQTPFVFAAASGHVGRDSINPGPAGTTDAA